MHASKTNILYIKITWIKRNKRVIVEKLKLYY